MNQTVANIGMSTAHTGDILARPKFVGQKGQLSVVNIVAMYEALSNQLLCCCSVWRIHATNLT